MRKQQVKTEKAKAKARALVSEAPKLALKTKNYILLGVGLVTIVAGFILLAMGSTRLAPLCLVTGYCVLVPLALLLK